MLSAIRQTVTIQHDRRLEIHAPELRPGSVVEVIILIEQPPSLSGPRAQLEAFKALQQNLQLHEQSATQWIQQVRDERSATGPGDE